MGTQAPADVMDGDANLSYDIPPYKIKDIVIRNDNNDTLDPNHVTNVTTDGSSGANNPATQDTAYVADIDGDRQDGIDKGAEYEHMTSNSRNEESISKSNDRYIQELDSNLATETIVILNADRKELMLEDLITESCVKNRNEILRN